MKKAIVIGATSGIGKDLAIILNDRGYQVGVTGRNEEILKSLNEKHGFATKPFDIAAEGSEQKLNELIDEMGEVELIVISAGIAIINKLDREIETKTAEINCVGFTKMAVTAYNYFAKKGRGHLVGLSSILALCPTRKEIAYSASKSYVSAYLEGLRHKRYCDKLPITITDVQPGFVDTPMTQGAKGMFWVAPSEKAAMQIANAIRRKSENVYITKRWGFVGFLLKTLPRGFLRWL